MDIDVEPTIEKDLKLKKPQANDMAAGSNKDDSAKSDSPKPEEPIKSSEETVASATSGGSHSNKAEEAIFNSKIAFPLNLTRMLEAVEGMGKTHIISWSDDGLSFIIRDIDAFLREVLPEFFKSSENTKIRSFYRKLNRWGFSMSRKNANNPNNVWHHPDYNRDSAKVALKHALDTGKATDFLNMASISRRRKRRGTDLTSEAGYMAVKALVADDINNEDDSTVATFGSLTTIDSSLPSETSLTSLSLTRSRSQNIALGRGMSGIASMPTLTSSRSSLDNINKRWKLAHTNPTAVQEHQQNEQRRLLSQSFNSGKMGGRTQSAMLSGQSNKARSQRNAVFEPIDELGGVSSSANATFDLSSLSSSHASATQANPLMMGLMSSASSGLNSNTLAPGPNSNTLAPSTNMFNLSLQQMLLGAGAGGLNTATTLGARGLNPVASLGAGGLNPAASLGAGGLSSASRPGTGGLSSASLVAGGLGSASLVAGGLSSTSQSNNSLLSRSSNLLMGQSSTSIGSNATTSSTAMNTNTSKPINNPLPSIDLPNDPKRQQQLRQEMTPEEDNELMVFLGNFAGSLPPPQEGDEDNDRIGEPTPLPYDRQNYRRDI